MKVCDKCTSAMIPTEPSYACNGKTAEKDLWFKCPRCGRHKIMKTIVIDMEAL